MLHTLAIAVDVSGSCADEQTMSRFWRETYECISQLQRYAKTGEILLMQCDTVIQKEERLRLEEFEGAPKQVDVRGMSGTSFVPVFERLNAEQVEGREIDALIYLTDGYGDFPSEKPDYPTYFVLEREDNNAGWFKIPEWIEKVYL